MDYYKKRNFKQKLKEHRVAIISTGAFALTALIVMLVGFAMSGWSIVKWLQSGYAETLLIVTIIGAFIAGMLIFFYYMIKGRK